MEYTENQEQENVQEQVQQVSQPIVNETYNANPIPHQSGNLLVVPKSIAAMILGISSIGGAFMYGIPGLVCAILALKFAKTGKKAYEENPSIYKQGSFSFVKTGRITGIIGLILSIVMIVVFVIIIVAAIIAANSYDSYNYDYNY